ncbi:MAG: hypothetical protein SGI88_01715 [Candidatus Hydrogenedentes bacterium]|nr:hypothetical protein [Candidatus Hydrogenedentota bacterium]
MSNTNTPKSPPGSDPANPYNIDFERERRLKRMFQVFIGVGFALAAILILAGYVMDALIPRESDGLAPVTPYSSPAVQSAPAPVRSVR